MKKILTGNNVLFGNLGKKTFLVVFLLTSIESFAQKGFYTIENATQKVVHVDFSGNKKNVGCVNLGLAGKYGTGLQFHDNLLWISHNNLLMTLDIPNNQLTTITSLYLNTNPLVKMTGPISFNNLGQLFIFKEVGGFPQGKLYSVNTLSGACTEVSASTSGNASILAIQHSPFDNTLYCVSEFDGKLYKMNETTGQVILPSVGPYTGFPFTTALTFANNSLIGLNIDNETISNKTTIHYLNTTTGLGQQILTLNGIFMGLAYGDFIEPIQEPVSKIFGKNIVLKNSSYSYSVSGMNIAKYSWSTSVLGFTNSVSNVANVNWGNVVGNTKLMVVGTTSGNCIYSQSLDIKILDDFIVSTINPSLNCPGKKIWVSVEALGMQTSVTGYDIILNYNANSFKTTGNYLLESVLTSSGSDIQADSYTNTILGILNTSISSNYLTGSGLAAGFGKIISYEFEVLNNVPAGVYTFAGSVIVSFDQTSTDQLSLIPNFLNLIANDPRKMKVSTLFANSAIPIRGDGAMQTSILGLNYNGASISYSNSVIGLIDNVEGAKDISLPLNFNGVYLKRDLPNSNSVSSVINSNDIFLARAIRQEIAPYDANNYPGLYELNSSDVNSDSKVLAGDVTAIRLRRLGLLNQFTNTEDWQFYNYPLFTNFNVTGNLKNAVPRVNNFDLGVQTTVDGCLMLTNLTFAGVLTGDIDKTWNYSSGTNLRIEGTNEFLMDFSKSTINKGGTYTTPVYIQNSDGVNNMDIDFYDNSQMTILGFNEISNSGLDILTNRNKDYFAVSILAGNKIDVSKPIFEVISNNLLERVPLDDSNLALVNGQKSSISYRWADVTGLSDKKEKETLSIYPNPSDNGKFYLTSDGYESFELYNLVGLKLFASGISNQTIDLSLFHSGFYILKVKSALEERVVKISIN